MAAQQGESTAVGEAPAIGSLGRSGRFGLSRYSLAGALLGAALVIAGAVLVFALGNSGHTPPKGRALNAAAGAGGATVHAGAEGKSVGKTAAHAGGAQTNSPTRARRGASAITPHTAGGGPDSVGTPG